jgi:hypothetical protein
MKISFLFSELHSNARARLCFEITLLHPALLNPRAISVVDQLTNIPQNDPTDVVILHEENPIQNAGENCGNSAGNQVPTAGTGPGEDAHNHTVPEGGTTHAHMHTTPGTGSYEISAPEGGTTHAHMHTRQNLDLRKLLLALDPKKSMHLDPP